MGSYLDEARDWARDEIDILKGRPTLRDEEVTQARRASSQIRKITLGRAAESLFVGMRVNGRSEAYIDRLEKLFGNLVPHNLKLTPLTNIKPKTVAEALANQELSPGNIRILRSLIGQIFERASKFHGPLLKFLHEFPEQFWLAWEKNYDVPFPELRDVKDSDYERIFFYLENEDTKWQQALCIRLYFEFGAPLSRIMSGRWRSIVDDTWYYCFPEERRYWYACIERIVAKRKFILDRLQFLIKRDFGSSEYFFPSGHKGKSGHITTVTSFWQLTLREINMPYYPLREFALSYRGLNHVSDSLHPSKGYKTEIILPSWIWEPREPYEVTVINCPT